MRLSIAVGGGIAFVASLIYFAAQYLVGFDASAPADAGMLTPVVIDVLLFSAFALHHSVFARSGFKAYVAGLIPPSLERSVYVWIASVMFLAVCAAWQPVPGALWATSGAAAWLLRGVQAVGGVLTLVAARHLDVFELSGIRQVREVASERALKLDDRGPYGLVRHPIYLGWLLLVWPAPVMNGTRLVFAVISTLYLAVAIPFEERDLRKTFGEAYTRYARKVRYRMLPGVY